MIKFDGNIVQFGFGAVGKSFYEKVRMEIKFNQYKYFVITMDKSEFQDYVNLGGIVSNFITQEVRRDNFAEIFAKYLNEGDLLIDFADTVGTRDICEWCAERNIMYINTGETDWPDHWYSIFEENELKNDLKRKYAGSKSKNLYPIVLHHGNNPGLVSHFVKAAIEYVADTQFKKNRKLHGLIKEGKFNLAAKELGLKAVHVNDIDLQKVKGDYRDNVLYNTWCVDSFWFEMLSEATADIGTHESEVSYPCNLVDITNYVMEEYGQPMHAYDLSTVAGNKIVVKRAADGDVFTTLDGQERKLDRDVLMICDGEKEIGIAGIMGGENSMVTDTISTLLFEAACFDGTNIRLSSKRIGLRTDASAKFEKGLDPNLALEAINRACQLIEEMGCGEVLKGVVDVYPNPVMPKELPFEPEKMNSLLGTDIESEKMLYYFKNLGLEYNKEKNTLTIPTFRQDLNCMADLAEEVARFYGYDNIPTTLPKNTSTIGGKPYDKQIEDIVMGICEENGFSQGMCYSFESPKVFDKLLIPEDSEYRNAIEISNPLGEDFSIMRTISLNGLLTSLAANFNRRNKNVRLYELGNVYIPKALPLTELPDEKMKLTLGMYGMDATHTKTPRVGVAAGPLPSVGGINNGDFFTLKGVVEEICYKLGFGKDCVYEPVQSHPFLHPGRQADIKKGNISVGVIGQLHPEAAENYDIKSEVYVAVLNMDALVMLSDFDIKYQGIAKYPGSTRDLSLVCDKSIFVGQIEAVIKKCGGKLLESYSLFDVYEGEQIEAGKKSVAYTMTFRAADRTLSDEEVNKVIDKILKELSKLGVEIRA